VTVIKKVKKTQQTSFNQCLVLLFTKIIVDVQVDLNKKFLNM